MIVKYLGPRDSVNVAPYGPHAKDQVKDYPDEIGKELLRSKKQRFEAVKEPEKAAPKSKKRGK